ncbi:MAG: hypothetical protein K2J24_03465 [Muribaculaceae bacterium]|nr:hypothetical protein [Muribaculaceae bacterium]
MAKTYNRYCVLIWLSLIAGSLLIPFAAHARQPQDSISGGGRYVWVPDSMAGRVAEVLMPDSARLGAQLSERVVYRGDTIPTVLKSRNIGRFDRGLLNYLYIPRGQWSFGITASYGEISTDDMEIFDLLSDIDISGHLFSINPYIAYFVRDNLSVGLKFGYSSTKGRIDSFKVDIDEDMNFDLHDIMYRNESYSAALTLRQYFGLTRRGRFGVFNEVDLAFASGNGDFVRPYNGVLRTTHTTTMQAQLNFSPGVSVFIMENVSFNVSFGVFGFNLRNEKQTVDGERMGNRFTSGANFRFNIFNINFGIAAHI